MKHLPIFNLGKKMEHAMWHAEEIDCSKDYQDFMQFNENEQNILKNTLAYFLSSDGILFENCEMEMEKIYWPEVRYFYGFKAINELVHSRSYGIQLDTIVQDDTEKEYLFDAIRNIPEIKQKAEWAIEGLSKNKSLAERKIYSICTEGIFFSSSFATIYWFKNMFPSKIKGITGYNDLIARDENLHVDFEVLLYKDYIQNHLSEEEVFNIFEKSVEIEIDFCKRGIPLPLIGINLNSMAEHIKSVANSRLVELGYKKLYNVSKTPFKFMEMIELEPKKNFFETRVTEYQKLTKKGIDFDLENSIEF